MSNIVPHNPTADIQVEEPDFARFAIDLERQP